MRKLKAKIEWEKTLMEFSPGLLLMLFIYYLKDII